MNIQCLNEIMEFLINYILLKILLFLSKKNSRLMIYIILNILREYLIYLILNILLKIIFFIFLNILGYYSL